MLGGSQIVGYLAAIVGHIHSYFETMEVVDFVAVVLSKRVVVLDDEEVGSAPAASNM